jgi:hypothetical protein
MTHTKTEKVILADDDRSVQRPCSAPALRGRTSGGRQLIRDGGKHHRLGVLQQADGVSVTLVATVGSGSARSSTLF